MKKIWYVVYTTPRGEKKANQRLTEKGVETYLPLRKTIRQWSDRKKKIEVPLFTSYLFVHVDLVHEKYPVLETYGVVAFVKNFGEEAVVRDEEIEAIKYLLQNFTEIETESLQPGNRVNIHGGSLKGQTGIIRDIKNNTLTLELENIGYQLVAKIPVEQVKLNV